MVVDWFWKGSEVTAAALHRAKDHLRAQREEIQECLEGEVNEDWDARLADATQTLQEFRRDLGRERTDAAVPRREAGRQPGAYVILCNVAGAAASSDALPVSPPARPTPP